MVVRPSGSVKSNVFDVTAVYGASRARMAAVVAVVAVALVAGCSLTGEGSPVPSETRRGAAPSSAAPVGGLFVIVGRIVTMGRWTRSRAGWTAVAGQTRSRLHGCS